MKTGEISQRLPFRGVRAASTLVLPGPSGGWPTDVHGIAHGILGGYRRLIGWLVGLLRRVFFLPFRRHGVIIPQFQRSLNGDCRMADPIKLPTLDDPNLAGFSYCGHLKPDAINRINPPLVWMDLLTSVHGPFFLRAIVGGQGKMPNHFHVEVDRPQYFPVMPRPNASQNQISGRIESLYGEEIELNSFARFIFQRDQMPQNGLLGRSAARSKMNETEIEPIEGKFVFHGGPSRGLSWKLARLGNAANVVAVVDVRYSLKTQIDSDYLQRVYATIIPELRRWVYGEAAGVKI